MSRFLFAFTVKSTGKKGEFSWSANTEKEAREKAHVKIADFEFTELDDVEVGEVLKIAEGSGTSYYECEGCSA